MKYHISEVTISADNASPLRLSLAIEKDYLILSQDAMEVEINPDELDIIAAQGKMLLDQFQEKAEQENLGKPPLGCKPRWLVDEERLRDLESAIERYEYDGYQVPQEWGEEVREIIKRREQRNEPVRPTPSGLLVERIRDELGHHETASASAVLLLVAKWLDGQIEVGAAHMLRQEAER
ncbi:MAG: hypothetical protein EBZ53_06690 [Verrucomicrobia bacterium]|nr:hypothetical protein [Verrucomicrobiota bacterium]